MLIHALTMTTRVGFTSCVTASNGLIASRSCRARRVQTLTTSPVRGSVTVSITVSSAAICGSETTPKQARTLAFRRGIAAAVNEVSEHRGPGLIKGSTSAFRVAIAMAAVCGGRVAVNYQTLVTPAFRPVCLRLFAGLSLVFMVTVMANYEATVERLGTACTSLGRLGICTGRTRCSYARDLGSSARRVDRSKILASNGGDKI